jgi:hypothetical protein
MGMPSFSLLFSLWFFEKIKNRQWFDSIDDFKIGAGEGNRTLVQFSMGWCLDRKRQPI